MIWRAVFWCLLLGLQGCSVTHALRVADGQRITVENMVAELADVPLVFVGENHDDMAHHDLQLRVIEGLQGTGEPLAIGLEMFQVDYQQVLDDWVAGQLPEAQFVHAYQANWRNLNWTLYRDIFRFARDQHVPLVALNVPQAIVQKVGRGGFTALSEADLQMLPPDAVAGLSAAELNCMVQGYSGHASDRQALFNLCQAQALRNRVMARAIERYQARVPQSRMVALLGALHAHRGVGVPTQLRLQRYKVLLPPMPGVDMNQPRTVGADYLLN